MIRLARKVHRVVSYLMFFQVSLWILGGVTFALLPFENVVKGGAVAPSPQDTAMPGNWMEVLSSSEHGVSSLGAVVAHESSQGLLLELRGGEGTRWIRAVDGRQAIRPDAGAVASFARQLYRGQGEVGQIKFLSDSQYRYLGLVDELYGRTGVWQVSFDDMYGTRFYFDGETGRYLTVRNDFWVFYDAMWRLHIMDYSGGENFNNPLLVVFALLGLIFVISGVILTLHTARRQLWRRSQYTR